MKKKSVKAIGQMASMSRLIKNNFPSHGAKTFVNDTAVRVGHLKKKNQPCDRRIGGDRQHERRKRRAPRENRKILN